MTNVFIHASCLKYLTNSLDTKIFTSSRNANSSISEGKKLLWVDLKHVFVALKPISSSSILILLLTTIKLKKCLSIIPLSIK